MFCWSENFGALSLCSFPLASRHILIDCQRNGVVDVLVAIQAALYAVLARISSKSRFTRSCGITRGFFVCVSGANRSLIVRSEAPPICAALLLSQNRFEGSSLELPWRY